MHQVISRKGGYCLLLVHFKGEAASTTAQMLEHDAGYTYCIFTGRVFDNWKEAEEEDQKKIVLETMTKDEAHPCLLKALEADWVSGSSGCWQVVTASSVQKKIIWESPNCVILGDAAHAMVAL